MKRDEIRLECLKMAQPCRDAAEAVAKARIYEDYLIDVQNEPGEPKKSVPKKAGNTDPLS